MDVVRQFWAEASLAKRLVVVMLVLLFASQFFMYNDSSSYGMLFVDADFNTTGYYYSDYSPVGTGWQIHPQAYIIIACLVVLYLNDFTSGRFWTRFGYWITLVLTFMCIVPGTTREPGGALGAVCVLLALIAAIVSVREARRMKAATKTAIPPAAS